MHKPAGVPMDGEGRKNVGNIFYDPHGLIVPTSRRRTVRVGMQPETLRVSAPRTQSVLTGVTTQSVGTIDNVQNVYVGLAG